MEIWKDIRGYEGYYQVSDLGNVRSLTREVSKSNGGRVVLYGKDMTKKENADSYFQVKLSKDGNYKTRRVHRLVMETFSPTNENNMEVNHIDLNRTNNCLSNLEWKTHIENVRHSSDQGRYKRYGERNSNYGGTKLKERFAEHPELALELARPGSQNGMAKKVILYDLDMVMEAEFDWIGGCAEYLINEGVTDSQVNSLRSRIVLCAKDNKPYKGYYFEIVAA